MRTQAATNSWGRGRVHRRSGRVIVAALVSVLVWTVAPSVVPGLGPVETSAGSGEKDTIAGRVIMRRLSGGRDCQRRIVHDFTMQGGSSLVYTRTFDNGFEDSQVILDLDPVTGAVIFRDANEFFDSVSILAAPRDGQINGAVVEGPEGSLRNKRLLRQLERANAALVDATRGIEPLALADRLATGRRTCAWRTTLEPDAASAPILDTFWKDFTGFSAPPAPDADPATSVRPATVGVVDQDQGRWYLVDPVLADLSGADVEDGGDPSGSGRAQLTFKQDTGRLCFDLDLEALQGGVAGVHIHEGAAGVNGPVVVDLDQATNGEAGCVTADTAIIDQIVGDLDGFNVTVHTDAFSEGALRGQLGGGPLSPFTFGDPGDLPFLGDWDGDGVSTPGVYRPSDGKVHVGDSNTPDSAGIDDIEFFIGDTGDIPIIGDWDGDGDDTVSLYRPSEGKVFIYNELGSGAQALSSPDLEFILGEPGDDPFGADFDGDGMDSVGVKRGNVFLWRNSLDEGPFDNEGLVFGDLDDEPMFGDWDGDGLETPGVFRPSTSTVLLRNLQGPGIADMEIFTDGFESGDTSVWSSGP